MNKWIKERLEAALQDVEVFVHPYSNGYPNGNYKVYNGGEYKEYDYCMGRWNLIDPISTTVREEINKYVGTDIILVASIGEESSCQVANIRFNPKQHIYVSQNMRISVIPFGIMIGQNAGAGDLSMILLPESNYPIAQFLTLMDGGRLMENNNLPEGITIKDYIEYGKDILNLEIIHTED